MLQRITKPMKHKQTTDGSSVENLLIIRISMERCFQEGHSYYILSFTTDSDFATVLQGTQKGGHLRTIYMKQNK